jgi:hypothetical protein
MDGPRQNRFAVFFGEEWCQLVDAAQVKTSVCKHLEKHRVLSGRTRDSHPKQGFVLRHMKHVGAVRK